VPTTLPRARALLLVVENRRAAATVVGVLASLVYLNSLGNDFAYDDHHIITNNTAIQSMETLPDAIVSPYWPGMFGKDLGLWRPTTQLLLGAQWIVSDGSAMLFHTVNVLAHAGVSVLVLLLLAELMSLPGALVAGLIFAVHPLHVEAVANVVGISELVSSGFFLAACLVHVRGPSESRWPRAIGIGLLYALAFGAKEGAVTLPGILFLLDAARSRLGFGDLMSYMRDRWRVYAALIVVAGALLIARHDILGTIANPLGPLGADLLLEIPRIWTISEVWSHYVRLWVFPLDLSADYSPNVIPISIGWHLANLVGLVLALLILSMSVLSWRRGPMNRGEPAARAAGFGVVWFMITLSPVSNTLFVSGVLLAERTLYLPSVGLAAASGWLAVRMWRERPRVVATVLAAAILMGSVRTWTRTPSWENNQAWLNTLVSDYPYSGRSQWVLGDAFMERGRTSEALMSYRAAVDILDSHYQLMTDVAGTFMSHDLYGGAEGLLQYAWRNEPRFALAPGLLAEIYSEWGRPEEAERYSRVALAIESRDPLRPHIISWSLAAQGRWDEAAAARDFAVETQGALNYWQQWLTVAYLEANEGDSASAAAAFDSARLADLSEAARRVIDSTQVSLLGTPEADSVARSTPENPVNR
jgi:hypothetical protein